MLKRVRRHVRWRLGEALRRRGLALQPTRTDPRVHARAPDAFELRGVELDLGAAWVTPMLRAAVYDGWYEESEAEVVEATMQPDDRVLEVGCGVGFLATIASRIVGGSVRAYYANPAMVSAARATLDRNGVSAEVTVAVLRRSPSEATTSFFVDEDFWTSSLTRRPEATEIRVPQLDFEQQVVAHRASYLIVDIEGGETDLLAGAIPSCVGKLLVECHPLVTSPDANRRMLIALLSQGFALNVTHSKRQVLYFERSEHPQHMAMPP